MVRQDDDDRRTTTEGNEGDGGTAEACSDGMEATTRRRRSIGGIDTTDEGYDERDERRSNPRTDDGGRAGRAGEEGGGVRCGEGDGGSD